MVVGLKNMVTGYDTFVAYLYLFVIAHTEIVTAFSIDRADNGNQ